MKIIDFYIKGNQVKFYVGADNCKDYWGDDWDDRPYEHNAGSVYDDFVLGYFVKNFDFDDIVTEPANGAYYGNSHYSKEDMKNRKVPCVCVLPKEFVEPYTYYDSFYDIVTNENSIKYFFGDKVDETKEEIHYLQKINGDKKYLVFAFDGEEKVQKMVAELLATNIFMMVGDAYNRKFDDNYLTILKNYKLSDYKKYITKFVKIVYEMLNLELSLETTKSIQVDFVSTKYQKPKNAKYQKYYKICIEDEHYFNVGEIFRS